MPTGHNLKTEFKKRAARCIDLLSVIMDTPIPKIILKVDTNNDEGIQFICAKASL